MEFPIVFNVRRLFGYLIYFGGARLAIAGSSVSIMRYIFTSNDI